jgi:riboflavin kinase, archaea type
MEIKGIVVSGTREGSYFMSKEIYLSQFEERLEFSPFIGTLNIKISSEEINLIQGIPVNKLGTIKGKDKFGDVKFITATINGKITGALIFPVKSRHPENILEFIAAENLRETLRIKDGDGVTLNIKI